jgi:hypothetical protein
MALFLKETLSSAKRMAQAFSAGLMVANMMDNLKITVSKEKELTSGQTGEVTLETGRTTKCTGRELSNGVMVLFTVDTIKTTRSLAMVNLCGQMADFIKATGKVANKMVKDVSDLSKEN